MSSDSLPQSTGLTTGSSSSSASDGNHVLVIALSASLSVIGLLVIAGTIFFCRRYRQRRVPFFTRGITPIDDDEIETWKVSREDRDEEKRDAFSKETGGHAMLVKQPRTSGTGSRPTGDPDVMLRNGVGAGATVNKAATSPTKKVPNAVIIYQTRPPSSGGQQQPQGYRRSEELSPRSVMSSSSARFGGGRVSMDKDLPQTPVQARAPNAREGLTDEAIPGDEPFIPIPKRQPSRISKLPAPLTSPRTAHIRTRSSRSSTRSFGIGMGGGGDYQSSPYGASGYYGGWSEQELHRTTPGTGSIMVGRASSDYPRGSSYYGNGYSPPRHHRQNYSYSSQHYQKQHSVSSGHGRKYSTSSIPPRLSFTDDLFGSPRPLLQEDIGRAIG